MKGSTWGSIFPTDYIYILIITYRQYTRNQKHCPKEYNMLNSITHRGYLPFRGLSFTREVKRDCHEIISKSIEERCDRKDQARVREIPSYNGARE